jgi:hypothetical protein
VAYSEDEPEPRICGGYVAKKFLGGGGVGILFREEVSGAERRWGTYREEISGTHGKELDEGLHSEDGGEEIVAVQQQRVEEWRPGITNIEIFGTFVGNDGSSCY